MEKTLTTIKWHVHQKSTKQAGKGVGLIMRIAAQDATKYRQDTKGGTRKATKTESTEKITVGKEKSRSILAHR
jgi:hypothetical protein